MGDTASDLLDGVRSELAPARDENPFLPRVAAGEAPLAAIAALAGEQYRIIPSDRTSFLLLAARASAVPAGDFFATLAAGESLALAHLPPLAAAAGLDADGLAAYQVRPGAQAYPAYVTWLAVHGRPVDAILALVANFAAWGAACAAMATALRGHYGFGDEACGFFDFFAAPAPDLDTLALTAVTAALDAGDPPRDARTYGRLLQAYEGMFWTTLAAVPGSGTGRSAGT
jgi:hypothetical protein